MGRVPLSVLATLSPLLLLPSPARAAALSFSPCAASAGFSCASLAVPLDRSGATPGTVSLSIERKLSGAAQSRDAVLALAGGPGQAMLPLAPYIAEAISPALVGRSSIGRDLLLFDQRGTGSSGALECPALGSQREIAAAHGYGELIARCARQLGPARGAYTTRESVQDIEALRQAAGYEKLVLYGTSYGTKVALEYAALYPQRVESLVLDSAETPEGPEPFHVATFKAMGPTLRELCSQQACESISSNPVGELARLVQALTIRPLSGDALDGRGRPVKPLITRADVFSLLLAGDLNPEIRPQLPAAVHAALNHDPAPLSRLQTLVDLQPPPERSSAIDLTLFLATSCEETPFPWQRSAPGATRAVEAEAALNALPSSDFYPFDPESALLGQTIPLCVSWPDASPAPPPVGALPNVPTLILSGEQDLRTPTENARRVAGLIPDAQLVQVPYTGHSVLGSDLSGCAKSALISFFAGSVVQGCAPAANRFRPAPLAPRALSSVAPMPGLGAPQARTVAGAVDSLLDLRRSVLTVALDFAKIPYGVRFGGLRGGAVRVTRAGALLERFSYVPGLQLTGLVPFGILLRNAGAAAKLTVSGPAGPSGRLRIGSAGRLSGVLAGRSFHVRAAAKVKLARAGQGGEASSPAFPLAPLARVP